MKKYINLILVFEVIACILLCAFSDTLNVEISILAFPFKQIGNVLRALSIVGAFGNIAAWILYLVICMCPLALLAIKVIKRRFKLEDILLGVLSGVLFPIIYFLINSKSYLADMVIPVEVDSLAFVWGAMIYSVIVGYVVIKAIRKFKAAGKEKLKGYLSVLLFATNVVLVYTIFGRGLSEVIEKWNQLQLMEYNVDVDVLTTKVFLIFKYAIDVILNVMVIGIIVIVQNGIGAIDIDNLTDSTVKRVRGISKLCFITIVCHIVLYLIYNMLQFAFMKQLYSIEGVVSVPLMMIIVMMIFMVIVEYMIDIKRIKDENDMFI